MLGQIYVLIDGTDDTNLRESFGFYNDGLKQALAMACESKEVKDIVLQKKSLLLWAEEVNYLHMKGLLKENCEVCTSLRCFYAKERDEGKFIIRSLDQIEALTKVSE